MIKLTLNLPKHRLRLLIQKRRYGRTSVAQIRFSLAKRASKRSFFPAFDAVRNVRVGSRISRLVRLFVSRVNLKTLVGRNLSVIAIGSTLLLPATNVFAQVEPEVNILSAGEAPISTELKVRYPTQKVKVNQGFSYFHWGIDFGGSQGDPVYPVMNGYVESVDSSRLAYGNHLIVDHKNGLKSLYAHLEKIEVEKGSEVTTKQIIGRMGSTGHSTGPHLHLEIYKNAKALNPVSVLGSYR